MAEKDCGKTAIEVALEAWAQLDAERERRVVEQLDLFADPVEGPSAVADPLLPAPTSRGPGRPPGARNKRSDELANFFIAKHGNRHPLDAGIGIAGLPVLAPGILEALAERLGCTRHDAFKGWLAALNAVLPYVAQRQAAIEIRPPGAPGSGQPILWQITEQGLELIERQGDDAHDVTPSKAAA